MKKYLLALLFILSFFSFSAWSEVAINGDIEYIDLIKGVYKDVKLEDLPDQSIFTYENKKFKKYFDVIYDNDRKVMRFKPKRVGTSTVRFVNKKDKNLILKQIKVTVQKNNLDQVAKEVKNLLREIEGIEIKVLNNKVVVDGYILLAKDLNRIAMVLNQYPEEQVASLVRLSPLTRKKIAERIEAEIDNPNIYVNVINDFYMLNGVESYQGEAKNAEKIAQAHISDTLSKFATGSARGGVKIRPLIKSPNPIVNNILPARQPPPPEKKLVQLVVHYVELAKSYGKSFNFSWAPTISETTDEGGTAVRITSSNNSPTNLVYALTATISRLLPRLNWAKQHGHARVLDTMNLSVMEGKTASVSSTKSFPQAPVAALGGQQPQPINISITTSVKDLALKQDLVNMQLDINIGEVSGEASVPGAGPPSTNNSISTFVSVRDKQSAALGGLLRSSSKSNYNRPSSPGTLFSFGADKDLQRAQSQFVIFVTPYIKLNASEGVENIKKKFRLDK